MAHYRMPEIPKTIPHSQWKPPPYGALKVNVDDVVITNKDYFGVGIVGRDSSGIVHFAEGRCFPVNFTPLAIKEKVVKALNSGWTEWILETDALNALAAITNPAPFAESLTV